MAVLVPLSLQSILDGNGRPLVGAQLYAYDAGTTTPKVLYRDPDLTSPHPQPILSDGFGRLPPVYAGAGLYKLRLLDPSGAQIAEFDKLQGEVAALGGGGAPVDEDALLQTGDAVWSYRTGSRAGFVRANGRTIGSGASGAAERANADCQALFEFLWGNDPGLAVSGGRGASSAADWSADKTIALPDLRFRAPFGLDDMGHAAAGRASGAAFAAGTGTTLGATGGAAAHSLAVAEMPSHSHAISEAAAGSHVHAGTTDYQGAHGHSYLAPGNFGFVGAGPPQTAYVPFAGVAATTDAVSSHQHGLVIAAAGEHVHGTAAEPTGGGGAHNTMPPFVLGTWYLKL